MIILDKDKTILYKIQIHRWKSGPVLRIIWAHRKLQPKVFLEPYIQSQRSYISTIS